MSTVSRSGQTPALATAVTTRRAEAAARDRSRAEHLARRAASLPPRRSTAELRRLATRGIHELAGSGIGAANEATAQQVVAWAAQTFGSRIAVASSMSDAILPHLVSTQVPWVDVLFCDTGYHFAETLGTRDAVAATMDVTVIDVVPDQSVAEQEAEYGPALYARDPGLCCQQRKVEPLHAALADYEVWVSGVRRAESWTRAQAPLVGFDENNGLVKINPLAAWSHDDAVDYATRHGVLVNPLIIDGYPSIGCAPCTQRVAPGADPRSGRWAGLEKTECGINR